MCLTLGRWPDLTAQLFLVQADKKKPANADFLTHNGHINRHCFQRTRSRIDKSIDCTFLVKAPLEI